MRSYDYHISRAEADYLYTLDMPAYLRDYINCLATFAWGDYFDVFVSLKTLAEKTHKSVRTILRYNKKLEQLLNHEGKRVIEIARNRGNKRPNVYKLNFKPLSQYFTLEETIAIADAKREKKYEKVKEMIKSIREKHNLKKAEFKNFINGILNFKENKVTTTTKKANKNISINYSGQREYDVKWLEQNLVGIGELNKYPKKGESSLE